LTGRAVFTDNVDLKLKTKLDGKATDVVKVKDPSRTVTARITVQPGAQFGWHTHPGPVVVNVVEGELVYVAADDCVEREYPANTAFIDAGGGHVHTAVNRTAGPTVLVATFFRKQYGGAGWHRGSRRAQRRAAGQVALRRRGPLGRFLRDGRLLAGGPVDGGALLW
jgi:quercetin dioxygenase-like cupin family protein